MNQQKFGKNLSKNKNGKNMKIWEKWEKINNWIYELNCL